MFSVKHTGCYQTSLFSRFTFQSAAVWRVINHVFISSQKAPDTLIIPYSCVFSHNNLALSCKDSLAHDLCVSEPEHGHPAAGLSVVFHFQQSFILESVISIHFPFLVPSPSPPKQLSTCCSFLMLEERAETEHVSCPVSFVISVLQCLIPLKIK